MSKNGILNPTTVIPATIKNIKTHSGKYIIYLLSSHKKLWHKARHAVSFMLSFSHWKSPGFTLDMLVKITKDVIAAMVGPAKGEM